MSDAWEEIQEIQRKRNSLRERLEKRKKERKDILEGTNNLLKRKFDVSSSTSSSSCSSSSTSFTPIKDEIKKSNINNNNSEINEDVAIIKKIDPQLEQELLKELADVTLQLPITSAELLIRIKTNNNNRLKSSSTHKHVTNLLQKFTTQKLISIIVINNEKDELLEVESVEVSKINAIMFAEENIIKQDLLLTTTSSENNYHNLLKRKKDDTNTDLLIEDDHHPLMENKKEKKELNNKPNNDDLFTLLAMASTKEKETKKIGEEILDLLSKPTAKERSLTERFKSQGGTQLMQFCPHGTKMDCEEKLTIKGEECRKLHFKKIIQKHTDESLGDCSFLNTCFHMETCKYVHYEVDRAEKNTKKNTEQQQQQIHQIIPSVSSSSSSSATTKTKTTTASTKTISSFSALVAASSIGSKKSTRQEESTTLYPPQWVQCDLRYLDMTVLGKFAVIMADPPWDIHMELPYGTMSDDEMRQLGIPTLQDDGLIFLWVTGRAMELGRECLKLWGYERVDEIIWVKTNQLQRIIRTGRTGHWLNHGKEHCLVGMKGDPKDLNRGLDSDVIVAEVRATSHKPDEIYGMIERLSPGTRKIELFGRPHNIQPNWITLGNQVDGVRLVDQELIAKFKKRYPNGNCMTPLINNTVIANNNSNTGTIIINSSTASSSSSSSKNTENIINT